LYSACAVTLSCFGHSNRSCLLTYLLTYLQNLENNEYYSQVEVNNRYSRTTYSDPVCFHVYFII